MEDYAPILWVLLIVGSMIASGISKARKQMRQGAEQTPPNVRPEQTNAPEGPIRPFTPMGYESPEKVFTYEDDGSDTTFAHEHEKPGKVFTYDDEKPDTTFTYEEITTDKSFTYEDEAPMQGETALMREFTQQKANPTYTAVTARKQVTKEPVPTKVPNEVLLPEEESAEGIAQQFDLRKAVIYSELLKPKFEE